MPMAIYSGLTVQQKQMRRLGGQAGAVPQGWHSVGTALAIPAWCKAKAMGVWGQALHGGDLWVSILPAQDVAQKTHNTLCSAAARAQLSDKLRTAAAKSGLAHAELGWQSLAEPKLTLHRATSCLCTDPISTHHLTLSSGFFQQSPITSLRIDNLVSPKLFH